MDREQRREIAERDVAILARGATGLDTDGRHVDDVDGLHDLATFAAAAPLGDLA